MELIKRIEEDYPKMSKGQKKIAQYIIENKEEVSYLSSAEVAKQIAISESSVVRFAYYFGYKKYKEMQEDIRKSFLGSLDILSQFNDFSVENELELDYLTPFQQELANINETFNSLDKNALPEIIEKIIGAKRIGVVSMRGATAPALIMSQFLNEILDNTISLTPGNGYSFDQIKSWDKNDLLICFEFLPVKSFSYSILKYAKEKGCFIISIVGELAGCIREQSDLTITVKKDGKFISYTSTILIVNILINLIAQKLKSKTLKSLEETEKILSQLTIV